MEIRNDVKTLADSGRQPFARQIGTGVGARRWEFVPDLSRWTVASGNFGCATWTRAWMSDSDAEAILQRVNKAQEEEDWRQRAFAVLDRLGIAGGGYERPRIGYGRQHEARVSIEALEELSGRLEVWQRTDTDEPV